jgi:peptidyl-prolyl cis-trans isomerase C
MKSRICWTITGLLAAAVLITGCSKPTEEPANEKLDLKNKGEELFTLPMADQQQPNADEVVVVINGTEVKQGEIDKEVMNFMARAGGRIPPERMAQMRGELTQQIVENLIVKNLLLEAIEAEKIEVTDEEIDEAIAKLKETLPPGTTLEQQLQSAGIDMAALRDDVSKSLRVDKLLKKGEEESAVSEEEIKEYYEANQKRFEEPEGVKASHILLAVKPEDTEETKAAQKAKAEEIRQQLVDGADFAALASENSDCPSSNRGGDLGKFYRGQMVPAFEDAAFTQDVDAIGPVVETRFGYHIIKVAEHDEARTVPLEEASEQISEMLEGQARQEQVREFIEGLKENAKIEYPGSFKPAPRPTAPMAPPPGPAGQP